MRPTAGTTRRRGTRRRGSRGERPARARFRERVAEIADANDRNERGGATQRDRDARGVPCPDCGAGTGTKCQRPSGHSVRKSHADRVEAAVEAGIIDETEGSSAEETTEQADIGGWA